MRGWEVNLGLNLGGAVRALLIGAGLLGVALPLTGVPVREPLVLIAALALLLAIFCSFGVVVGVYAESWDHSAFVTNLVILPLSFLGGVFYSVGLAALAVAGDLARQPALLPDRRRPPRLPGHERRARRDLARGRRRRSPPLCVAWSCWLFATGRRLKP